MKTSYREVLIHPRDFVGNWYILVIQNSNLDSTYLWLGCPSCGEAVDFTHMYKSREITIVCDECETNFGVKSSGSGELVLLPGLNLNSTTLYIPSMVVEWVAYWTGIPQSEVEVNVQWK